MKWLAILAIVTTTATAPQVADDEAAYCERLQAYHAEHPEARSTFDGWPDFCVQNYPTTTTSTTSTTLEVRVIATPVQSKPRFTG